MKIADQDFENATKAKHTTDFLVDALADLTVNENQLIRNIAGAYQEEFSLIRDEVDNLQYALSVINGSKPEAIVRYAKCETRQEDRAMEDSIKAEQTAGLLVSDLRALVSSESALVSDKAGDLLGKVVPFSQKMKRFAASIASDLQTDDEKPKIQPQYDHGPS